jgi:hypothetical protein
MGKLWLKPPIFGLVGRFDAGSGRRRGGWDGGFGVVRTFIFNPIISTM